MLAATFLYEHWAAREKALLQKISRKLNEEQEVNEIQCKKLCFAQWFKLSEEIGKKKAEDDQLQRIIDILKNSTRGQRSTMEKEEIRRFVVTYLTCIPKSISFSEMDTLCNEIDWYPYIGRSILFLQGDFGNCYYMIARGRVGLYLEPSKDREMEIAREFGDLRGQPFEGSNEDLSRIGNNIFNLPQGAGFGEYAILATTNKIRSCACVNIDDISMCLIMHAETYNTVLRQHHYRQKQLSSATALLQELPLFKHHNYSKVASVAYTMRSQTYSNQAAIVNYGDTINNVLLIAAGQVKVYAAPKVDENQEKKLIVIHKRIPKLAIALLGRGSIIGEMEIQKGLRTFQLTYESGAAATEVLEMPATVFKDSLIGGGAQQTMMYKSIEEMNEAKELRRVGRMSRAYDAMKNMMSREQAEMRTKDQLTNILPVLIDTPISGAVAAVSSSGGTIKRPEHHGQASEGAHRRHSQGSYYGDAKPAVTRKSSFSVQLCPDNHPIPSSLLASTSAKQPSASSTVPAMQLKSGMRRGSSLKFTSPNSGGGGGGGGGGVGFSDGKEDQVSGATATTSASGKVLYNSSERKASISNKLSSASPPPSSSLQVQSTKSTSSPPKGPRPSSIVSRAGTSFKKV